jgi:hypothetical protein
MVASLTRLLPQAVLYRLLSLPVLTQRLVGQPESGPPS